MKRLLNIIDKDAIWDFIRACTIATISAATAYFESTYTFIIALFLAFIGNILAGFEADEVKIKLKRIFPPVMLFDNFSGNKFKDSLAEFALILIVIYSVKGLFDLMKVSDSSYVAVQAMMGIAIYVYLRNSLRNLKTAYPKILFFKILYALVALKFKDFFGEEVSNIVNEEEEKNGKKRNHRKTK